MGQENSHSVMATTPIPVPSTVGLSRGWLGAILIATLLSFVGKVVIASRPFGSLDARLWEANLQELQEAGPAALYEHGTVLRSNGVPYHTEVFNHPPFTIRLLWLGGWLSQHTRMPLRFWLRAACAAADLASMMLILRIVRGTRLYVSPLALLLVAASPISLLISGFHGNTDPIMIAFLLLAAYCVHRKAPLRAGAALGLAASIKIVPLLFTPALALCLPGRKRAVFLAGAIGVFFAGSLPLIIDRPGLIWSHVFGYTPQTGIWGIPRFVAAFGTEMQVQAYAHFAKGVLLLVLGVISVWLNLRRPQPPVVLQCGLLAFVLIWLAPGFGVQYLAWLTPWAWLLSGRQATAFQSIGGFFLTWYYTQGAHLFPRYLANSAATQVWHGPLIFVGLLCWVVIGWLSFVIFRRIVDLTELEVTPLCRHTFNLGPSGWTYPAGY
jgi:Glycosyltransferase family 87